MISQECKISKRELTIMGDYNNRYAAAKMLLLQLDNFEAMKKVRKNRDLVLGFCKLYRYVFSSVHYESDKEEDSKWILEKNIQDWYLLIFSWFQEDEEILEELHEACFSLIKKRSDIALAKTVFLSVRYENKEIVKRLMREGISRKLIDSILGDWEDVKTDGDAFQVVTLLALLNECGLENDIVALYKDEFMAGLDYLEEKGFSILDDIVISNLLAFYLKQKVVINFKHEEE